MSFTSKKQTFPGDWFKLRHHVEDFFKNFIPFNPTEHWKVIPAESLVEVENPWVSAGNFGIHDARFATDFKDDEPRKHTRYSR